MDRGTVGLNRLTNHLKTEPVSTTNLFAEGLVGTRNIANP